MRFRAVIGALILLLSGSASVADACHDNQAGNPTKVLRITRGNRKHRGHSGIGARSLVRAGESMPRERLPTQR
jgi:hypothetical protein